MNEFPFNREKYRGRLAPSPTGLLHLGHARTFWMAQERARASGGTLVLRNEDLDPNRCKPEFVSAMIEDLRWFGIQWQEGPDCGGPFGPYNQSQRYPLYLAAFEKLRNTGQVFPCSCSRQDVLQALQAPHQSDDEPVYPGTCRPTSKKLASLENFESTPPSERPSTRTTWRFRVPEGESIVFHDSAFGQQTLVAGVDFGDFVVWRQDDVPSYQLAVVVDDGAMGITEVVRGADLLRSTARQLLLYRALGLRPPTFCHCTLLTDHAGVRLAKRHASLSLRRLRDEGQSPERLRAEWR